MRSFVPLRMTLRVSCPLLQAVPKFYSIKISLGGQLPFLYSPITVEKSFVKNGRDFRSNHHLRRLIMRSIWKAQSHYSVLLGKKLSTTLSR